MQGKQKKRVYLAVARVYRCRGAGLSKNLEQVFEVQDRFIKGEGTLMSTPTLKIITELLNEKVLNDEAAHTSVKS